MASKNKGGCNAQSAGKWIGEKRTEIKLCLCMTLPIWLQLNINPCPYKYPSTWLELRVQLEVSP